MCKGRCAARGPSQPALGEYLRHAYLLVTGYRETSHTVRKQVKKIDNKTKKAVTRNITFGATWRR